LEERIGYLVTYACYQEFYLPGYNNMYSVEIQPPLGRNVLTPSSGSMNKLSSYLLHAGFMLGLFIDCEDGDDIFLRNVS
jgi:hypothetical protein